MTARRARLLELALWAASAGFVGATFAWPTLSGTCGAGAAQAVAEKALASVADGERAYFAKNGRFVAFAPDDRQAKLPDLALEAEAAALAIDARVEQNGALRLRAVTRPEAIRDGRLAPVLHTVELAAAEPVAAPAGEKP